LNAGFSHRVYNFSLVSRLKKIVERERNKIYYRVLHVPVWIWVFFVLPGNLTHDLYQHGPDRRHAIWLLMVTLACVWRGFAGRLPGVEPQPYVTHFGVHQPNLWYRVVCYTAAWIDLLVPFALNFIGLVLAVMSGRWMLRELYAWLYYPLALAVVLAAALDVLPRTRQSTLSEGSERAWFYVAIWTVVPAQLAGWAMWRMGRHFAFSGGRLALARLSAFVLVAACFFSLGALGRLGRTSRYVVLEDAALEESAG
jgi:hypothetical protein